jgi:protein-tyrosine-phosphatase
LTAQYTSLISAATFAVLDLSLPKEYLYRIDMRCIAPEDFVTTDLFRIIFVCTGNTCRSPMAEGILKKQLMDEFEKSGRVPPIEVTSAGTHAFPGQPASRNSVLAAGKHGIDLDRHFSRRLTRETAESADLIVTMERNHVDDIHAQWPDIDTAFDLRNYGLEPSHSPVSHGIPDPIGMGVEVYARVFEELEREIARVAPLLFMASRRKFSTDRTDIP